MFWNKILKFFDNRNTLKLRVKIFLWYYRILHTTFGGLTISSDGQLSVNKYWKAYGILFGVLSGIWNCVSIHLFRSAPVMVGLYESGFVTNYYMSLALKAFVEIRCIFLFWFLQIHGIHFFHTFFIYKIEKSKTLCKLFFVWILHILVPIAVGSYQLIQLKSQQKSGQQVFNFYRIFFVFVQNFLGFSVSWSISFLMWNISVCAFENLKKVEANLTRLVQHKSVKSPKVNPLMNYHKFNQNMSQRDILSSSKAIFFDIKRQIRALDKSLSVPMVVDVSVAILIIMLQIYALAQNSPVLRQYATIIGFNTVSEITRLVINCWANGLVYERTEKIFSLLDDFNPNDLDEHMYREWIAFKTMSRDVSYGFTIGGLAPLRKSTLLSIFGFMMNYTVILIQTAKYM